MQLAKEAPSSWSMEALARRLGVSVNTVHRWELGKMRPSTRHARQLARELGVSVETLGLGDDDV